MVFKITRNGITKTHGTVTFTASSSTAGTAAFSPGSHAAKSFPYTLNGTSMSIDLSTHLVLSGNTAGHDITYISATGTVTAFDASNNPTTVSNGVITFSSAEGPGNGDDSWVASASTGDDLAQKAKGSAY